MKKIPVIIMIFTILVSQQVLSQVITKSVIGSCGQTQVSEGNKISWSLGEPVVGTMTAGGHQLGNGFLPSLDYSVLFTPEKEDISFIEIYPNPATEFIKFKSDLLCNLEITISSTEGKEILRTVIKSDDMMNITALNEGLYLMKVTDLKGRHTSSYKVIVSR